MKRSERRCRAVAMGPADAVSSTKRDRRAPRGALGPRGRELDRRRHEALESGSRSSAMASSCPDGCGTIAAPPFRLAQEPAVEARAPGGMAAAVERLRDAVTHHARPRIGPRSKSRDEHSHAAPMRGRRRHQEGAGGVPCGGLEPHAGDNAKPASLVPLRGGEEPRAKVSIRAVRHVDDSRRESRSWEVMR